MVSCNILHRYEKLFIRLYSKATYNDFQVAMDFAIRAFNRISKHDLDFRSANFYLSVINCEDRIISSVCEYYLEGRGEEQYLNEDVFQMIDVLSGHSNDITVIELKQLFLKVYCN